VPSAAGTYVPRPPRSHVKLTPFNGTGSLETFLAKFENMARYLEWNEADRYYHLCACLEGTAGQVLWDAGPQATTQSVINLLRTRFGNELQAERFKAELRTRRGKSGETLQHLYQDVCRMVAMAYPSSEPALIHHVAKKAFIAALGDPTLQLKVMEREPKTVEDALNFATKLEAYKMSLSVSGCVDDLEDGRNRRRPKKVCAVGDGSDAREVLSLRQQVSQLQDALFQTTQRLEALAADTERNRVEPAKVPPDAKTHLDIGSVATTGVASHPPLTSGSGRGNGRGRGVRRQARDADICRACGEAGHWAKDCKKRLDAPTVKGVVCQRPASTRV